MYVLVVASTPEIKSTLKDEGNKLFQDKKYDEAVVKFTAVMRACTRDMQQHHSMHTTHATRHMHTRHTTA